MIGLSEIMMEPNQTLHSPRFMREVILPAIPSHLDDAALESISIAEKMGNFELLEIRKCAYTALKRLGLPNSTSEEFTFIRLNEFLPFLKGEPSFVGSPFDLDSKKPSVPAEIFSPFIFPEANANYVVILDGRFSSEHSQFDSNLQVTPMSPTSAQKGLTEPRINLETRQSILAALSEETDASSAMAALFSVDPLFISIPQNHQSPTPLQILHLHTGTFDQGKANLQHAMILIQAGKNSELKILVRHENLANALSTQRMFNLSSLAIIEENASLKVFESSISDENIHFHKLTARVNRNARLSCLSAQTGSKLTRNSYAIDLMGENAETEINGATVLIGNRQVHQHIQIRHLVPHCNSRQHFKSVATDNSRSSVDGTIVVAENANGTNAHQLINNLMLSDSARTYSKPQLKIYADDVKCAHGSTTGKLDAAQQFYLESRGLTPILAKAALTIAFVSEILEKCGEGIPHFRAHINHSLIDVLKLKLPTYSGVADGQ